MWSFGIRSEMVSDHLPSREEGPRKNPRLTKLPNFSAAMGDLSQLQGSRPSWKWLRIAMSRYYNSPLLEA